MRPVNVWLERFRRPAAVPAAASEERDSELMPVFASLDAIEEEARTLRTEAERAAARRVDVATVESERILARWRKQAEVERIKAENARRRASTSQARSIEHEAELEAARVRERGLEGIPGLVASVIACVKEDV